MTNAIMTNVGALLIIKIVNQIKLYSRNKRSII